MRNWKCKVKEMVRSKAAEVPNYSALWLSAQFCQLQQGASLYKLMLGEAEMVSSVSDESKQSCRCTLKSTNRKRNNIAPSVSLKQYAIESLNWLVFQTYSWKSWNCYPHSRSEKEAKCIISFGGVVKHHMTLTKVMISAELKQDWQ